MGDIYTTFSNCIISKGSKRSIISDIQCKNYFFIPNSIADTLRKKGFKKDEITNCYGESAFRFLIENAIIFNCESNNLNLFPSFNLTYESPNVIENAIIDRDDENYDDIEVIIKELDILFCESIQVRFKNAVSGNFIHELVNLVEETSIESIELILPYSNDFSNRKVEEFIEISTRLTSIIFFSSERDLVRQQKQATVIYYKKHINPIKDCGCIKQSNFVSSIKFSSLANSYNTCLYKKVSFDTKGNIKNCLSMDIMYGNIFDSDLKEVIQSEDFQKLWHIKKDNIKVCKACEFRHMCMDCRTFIKDPNDIYSQPVKCTYNPYIAKWKGEDGYITVEEWQQQKKKEVL